MDELLTKAPPDVVAAARSINKAHDDLMAALVAAVKHYEEATEAPGILLAEWALDSVCDDPDAFDDVDEDDQDAVGARSQEASVEKIEALQGAVRADDAAANEVNQGTAPIPVRDDIERRYEAAKITSLPDTGMEYRFRAANGKTRSWSMMMAAQRDVDILREIVEWGEANMGASSS